MSSLAASSATVRCSQAARCARFSCFIGNLFQTFVVSVLLGKVWSCYVTWIVPGFYYLRQVGFD